MELMEEVSRLYCVLLPQGPRDIFIFQHPRGHGRRQSRQLLEGLGKLLGGLLGLGGGDAYDYDYYDYQGSIPDNIALSLYGEWPWQGGQL